MQRLNKAAEAGNCQICMWILSRRFSEEFDRRIYQKMNVVSKNQNETVEIIVKDTDRIREKILDKFALGRENQDPPTVQYFYSNMTYF